MSDFSPYCRCLLCAQGTEGPKMRYLAIAILIAVYPAYGQPVSVPDQEVMRLRQAIADKYAVAINNKNTAAAVAEVFAADAVLQSLCPESPLAFGREAYAKRLEG